MPLSEQEQRCINLTLEYLDTHLGGSWHIERYLDDAFPSETTPEVVVTNGKHNAAIEAKRLIDPETQELIECLYSNERSLAPSCGGYYWLETPPDYKYRMDKPLKRHLKKEIERVAPSLQVDKWGALHMPRSGRISHTETRTDSGLVNCCHYGPFSDLLYLLSARVKGNFFLDDLGPNHSFFTEEGQNAFYDTIADACQTCPEGESTPVEWHEEWKLTKTRERESGKKDGVWIMAASEVINIDEASRTAVKNILGKAMPKFQSKRWANLHVLVIDWIAIMLDPVLDIVKNLQPNELEPIDLVLIVKDNQIFGHSPIRES